MKCDLRNRGTKRLRWLLAPVLLLLTTCYGISPQSATDISELNISPTPIPRGLVIDTSKRLGQVSPRVYGVNYGPWMNIDRALLPLLETAGLTFLRFPGGNWGDEHDLSTDQIDQLIELSRRIDAEPSISVRLRGGTPEAAAQLVTYTNVTRDYDVRYWSIGNEPSLYSDYNTMDFNREWRAFAQAMLAVDPNILLLGPEIHQYTGTPPFDPEDQAGRNWLREFLSVNGDLVDIVSIHRYPFPASESALPATTEALKANSREWDVIIPNLQRVIRETTGRNLPIAVTEINSHWRDLTGGEATPDSYYNAIWWSDVLGRLIRQRVDIVAYFALQTDIINGGWGILAENAVRPVYLVYQIYQHFGDELVYAVSDEPDVSVYAALKDPDALTVIVINLGPMEKTLPLRLQSRMPARLMKVMLLDETHPAQEIDPHKLTNGSALTLPAQSMSLLIFNTSPIPK